MAHIRPFCGVRPTPELAQKISALPYDVYSSSEARRIVEENPLSFLKIDRAETQFPEGTDMYSQAVYEKARDTLKAMEQEGQFVRDKEECFYIYELTMSGRSQTGLVCCVAIDDYLNQVVKKHENTREDKELDRIRHVDTVSAHTGPIFLAYRGMSEINDLIAEIKKEEPLYDFSCEQEYESETSIRHRVWKIGDSGDQSKEKVRRLAAYFAEVESLYVADGHHRAASAVKAGLKRRQENPAHTGEEEFNYFLSVLFPAEELRIYDYNRVVHKLEMEVQNILPEILKEKFEVKRMDTEYFRPKKKSEIGMYINHMWYCLTAKKEICSVDPVEGLDVSLLQNHVLGPVLGINEPKTDPRIQFVGGIRGLGELKKIVDSENGAAAFAMYPTSMEELLRTADAGRLMPPKSTWFEPKLRSGLFIHTF